MAKMQSSEQGFGHEPAEKNDSAVAVREPEAPKEEQKNTISEDDLLDDSMEDFLSADVGDDNADADFLNVDIEETEAAPSDAAAAEAITAQMTQGARSDQTYHRQEKTDRPYWYVVYTYAGYEKRVMDNILKTAQNRDKDNTILDVKVPEDETIEIKNGQRQHVTRKRFPGYVMVKMYLTDQSWSLVRNTRGVTGFVGPSSNPIPLTDREVRAMGIEDVRIDLDVKVGDTVIVTSGPFANFEAKVESVDPIKQSVGVRTTLFGREVPLNLDFVLVKKI